MNNRALIWCDEIFLLQFGTLFAIVMWYVCWVAVVRVFTILIQNKNKMRLKMLAHAAVVRPKFINLRLSLARITDRQSRTDEWANELATTQKKINSTYFIEQTNTCSRIHKHKSVLLYIQITDESTANSTCITVM